MDGRMFFSSFDDFDSQLWNGIRKVTDDSMYFSRAISALYFAWSGIVIHDAIKIRKCDISSEENSVRCTRTGASVSVHTRGMEYIRARCLNIPGPIDALILSSDCFRKISILGVEQVIGRLNAAIDPDISRFTYHMIYLSGLFGRAIQREKTMEPLPYYSRRKTLEFRHKVTFEYLFEQKFPDTRSLFPLYNWYNRYKEVYCPERHVVPTQKRMDESAIEKLKYMYLSGCSIGEMSEVSGRKEMSVRNALTNYGISSNPEFRETRKRAKIQKKEGARD